MLTANLTLLYVYNVPRSADFYAGLFDLQPVEQSPTFALFILPGGFKLGLWSRYTVEPATGQQPGSATGELVFKTDSQDEVDQLYRQWGARRDLTIIQTPVRLDFGYTFSAIDPDGHRLRVCFLLPDES